MRHAELDPGHTRMLGASVGDDAVNFALAAPHAEAVELCLFEHDGRVEAARLELRGRSAGIWHGSLPLRGRDPGELVYGWRVHGPWAPGQGHRFNPAKLLLDPAARDVLGRHDGAAVHLGHAPGEAGAAARPDPRDNAATALKARVVRDLPPPRPLAEPVDPAARVICEIHVKGYTARHPDVPPPLRGSYAGLAHPACVASLRELGVTTVSLLPVAFRADEARLLTMGMTNYWGYNPAAWSAPEPRYWSGAEGSDPRSELRDLVDAMHAAGIEVVLDVVYNHTAEGGEFGPTLSLRGIDNALYYRLRPDDRALYENWSGCGNSVDLSQPLVLRVVLESLRRWVLEYGVDGFRFDLAASLGRGGDAAQGAFQAHSAFVCAVAQDPVLSQCLMIAEPWDLGPGGYQLGGFPPGWLEWNDRFRDAQRGFWLRRDVSRGEFARRLAGSSDVFDPRLREPWSSVNFVAAHDGFTLRDAVSYAHRHNQANGEEGRDGNAQEISVNNGVEGETDRPDVLAARAAQRRALLASTLLGLGTPMFLAGDEVGHTQHGNNNAYCQDGPTSWIDWAAADTGLRDLVRGLIALRRSRRPLQARGWWRGDAAGPGPRASWLGVDGAELSTADWDAGGGGPLALLLEDAAGAALLLINPLTETTEFTLPAGSWDVRMTPDGFTLRPRRALVTERLAVAPAGVVVATRAASRHVIATEEP